MPKRRKLRAADVLNWNKLCRMSKFVDPAIAKNYPAQALAVFAYAITKTDDEDKRDRILSDILNKAVFGSQPKDNEKLLRLIAYATESNLGLLRKFAKQCGVHQKRNW
jgi:hypothetical protein